jgi:hypothetical protein
MQHTAGRLRQYCTAAGLHCHVVVMRSIASLRRTLCYMRRWSSVQQHRSCIPIAHLNWPVAAFTAVRLLMCMFSCGGAALNVVVHAQQLQCSDALQLLDEGSRRAARTL